MTADDDVQLGAVRLAVIDPGGGTPAGARLPHRRGSPASTTASSTTRTTTAATCEPRHPLPDACDTTLLPHLYEEHGAAMVDRMRGMFAFALWDGAARTLLLARDRLGIKPLFWARTARLPASPPPR